MENVNSFFCGGEEKRRGKKRKTFGEGKYLILEEKENGEGKGGKMKICEKGNFVFGEGKKEWRRKRRK